MRIELGPDRATQGADRPQMAARTHDGACDEITMAAHILGQGIDREIGTMRERRLEHGTEQRVVTRNNRTNALPAADRFGDTPYKRDIDNRVHRIRRRLDKNY